MSDDQHNQKSSSFVSGFSIGLFLGASGYFLFKSKEGNKLKQKLGTEWDDIKVHLAKAGMIPSEDMTVKDLAEYLMKNGQTAVAEKIASTGATKKTTVKTKKTASKSKAKIKKKKKISSIKKNRFKGV